MLWPLVGAGLGLASSLFAPDEQTATTQNMPSGYLTGSTGGPNILGQASNLLGQYYPQLWGGAGREANAANALYQRGRQGSPLEQQGQSFVSSTLGGRYLNNRPQNSFIPGRWNGMQAPNTFGQNQTASNIIGGQGLSPQSNPYLQQTFDTAAEATRGRLASEFAGAGRDKVAALPARSQELQTLAANIFGGNYQRERDRQASLTGQGIGLGQADLSQRRNLGFGDLSQVRSLGQQGYQFERGMQGSALGQALPFANQDYRNLAAMSSGAGMGMDNFLNRIGMIAPAMGGTATTTQPVYNDPFGSLLGGGMMGASIGNIWGTPKTGWGSLDPTKNTL